MKPLRGLTFAQITDLVTTEGLPRFAAKQVCDWIYNKHITSLDEMTNLSLAHRTQLSKKYTLGNTPPIDRRVSEDGTVKYLFPTPSGRPIESVYIPDKERATLCISSQIGCKMGCQFCMTGKQGYQGQLSASEIINQIYAIEESSSLTNIVFMGMGEPMDNITEVLAALEIITSPWGMAWSPKRVTVSSIGVIPSLTRLLNESQCHIAISLHSPYPAERLSLMPIEQAYPIQEIITLLNGYDFSKQRRLSFEYIPFASINDSLAHAASVVKLVKGLSCRVNLIRYHAIPEVRLNSSDEETMTRFRDYLTEHGVTSTIRTSRGEDIWAACGMLSSDRAK